MGGFCVSTGEFRELFEREIGGLGGRVAECIEDGVLLFGRSVLARTQQVGPGDVVQAGVAIRCGACGVKVQPYVFRLVCRNGTIFAHAFESRCVEIPEFGDPRPVLHEVREAIHACASNEAIRSTTHAMAMAREQHTEPSVWLMMLEREGRLKRSDAVQIMSRFADVGDPSRFGLMNAMTSLARDTRDPQRKGDLEELGGALVLPVREPLRRPMACDRAVVVGTR